MKTIDHLIINSPYGKPKQHLKYNREIRKFELLDGRRSAGYVVASEHSESFDDPGIFVELELANRIRERIDKWRDNGYPGITSITRDLLEHWKNPERETKFFFCQIEAIETLIWFLEAPESEKQGIEIPSDGGDFQRICSKMATGSGKTIVMAMLIAWHIINKATYPKDQKFSKNVLIVAPGLTVKSRLQVLIPDSDGNYFEAFDIVPQDFFDKLRHGKVKIINWHALDWNTQERINKKIEKGTLRTVDKRKTIEISDEAYIKQVLEDFADCKNILIINDEAHHAWRVNPEAKGKYTRIGEDKDSAEEATIWISGLDRINKVRGIL
ncbi:MAG: DEAD/DEAH box helicase family protein, partial [Candidatus Woesearchaeota archaeon]|nr:DEAD/DEAH box helicase family protein [Candidatus Woesearchaeota archaeon]